MMHQSLPTILLVVDELGLGRAWKRVLSPSASVLVGETREDSLALFASHPDLSLIAVDGCLGGYTLNTLDLIREFRKTFNGPMIAASSTPGFCDLMCMAGCSHRVIDKNGLPNLVMRLLAELKLT